MIEAAKILMKRGATPADQVFLIDMQARDAYEKFMTAAYGRSQVLDWFEMPIYVRDAWRQVILHQEIETELDTKYHLVMIAGRPRIANKNSGEAIPEDEPVMIFRARDQNFLPNLVNYHNLCRLAECSSEHMRALEALIYQFTRFREEHPERMKRPGDPAGKIVYSATSESPKVTATLHPPGCSCEICQEPRK